MDARTGTLDISDREIYATRLLDAPRELVWRAWTEPAHIARWWGPSGFTNTIHKMEVRPGGEWLFVMHGPDGTNYDNWIVFQEVIPPRRLVYQHGEKGRPDCFVATVTFTAQENQTRLDMQMLFETADGRDLAVEKYNAIEGQKQTLKRLEEYLVGMGKSTGFQALPGKQEILVTHVFDAPVERVFEAWVDPQLIPQWWGPAYLTTFVDRMETRTGGSWRIVQHDPKGNVHGFHGVYHSVETPNRIVETFEYEGTPGHVVLDTVNFEAQGNQTRVTDLSVFQTVADRDAMVESGCEQGVIETMGRMDALLLRQLSRRTS